MSSRIANLVEARCDTSPSETGCFGFEEEFPFLDLSKRDVPQRERGLRKSKVSLSHTDTLIHTETEWGKLKSQDRTSEKEKQCET